ncbi:hypothetical protein Aaci_1198 [Alicyclobacillus acidocaldarius subsp. acidocaldarius DSM 446]|uniref:Uncharacterized protein n=1 Tax=Alicyclobacillus acidocaldarius subsp. acidocaldarius (strain ATCC 27009 / DSM 446 / BCRC 14685 / JCM 5260 / KCTC 1825 / NBRC 15652 / NCIMB 11725 / NRRL B-14509 / 104-IA) TaxID=521098 RepID=C8WVV7_ALIAD|nr:hypothetical protein Aaci_1198 [Alicyclobacillus acidocaldarius subsp. acidocaldarius DSM 446]
MMASPNMEESFQQCKPRGGKSERLTRHYTVTVKNGVAVLHHTPFSWWPWYWMDKDKFLRERLRAYRKLAQSGRTDIREVRGYSLWIEYARDGFQQHEEPVQFWRDQMGLIFLWLFNVHNWRVSRIPKLMRLLHREVVHVGTMDWATFVERFG